MIKDSLLSKIECVDIKNIDLSRVFLHYTNISNLNEIIAEGLKPRIGINAKMIEKSKKVFFSMGDKGALVIVDVWIKWLITKPTNNFIYWLGAFLLRIPHFPTIFHDLISGHYEKNIIKKKWAFNKMKEILDNSIYLVLDLKENEDFSFNDIDEAKNMFKFSPKYVEKIYANDSNLNNFKMEYWNMHTYSDKIIEQKKIKLLKINNSYSASDIIKYIADNNTKYIKDNCKLLDEYLKQTNKPINE